MGELLWGSHSGPNSLSPGLDGEKTKSTSQSWGDVGGDEHPLWDVKWDE